MRAGAGARVRRLPLSSRRVSSVAGRPPTAALKALEPREHVRARLSQASVHHPMYTGTTLLRNRSPVVLVLFWAGVNLGSARAPVIHSITPDELPVAGADALITVAGSGFGESGTLASCRLASATPGSAWTHAGYAGKTDLRVPATVVNDTTLTCIAPSVIAPGPGIISVAVDCKAVPCALGNWGQHVPWQPGLPWAEPARVSYFSLIDATVGRRPYVNESHGALLIATHKSLWGSALTVTAELPTPGARSAGLHWTWTIRPRNGSDTVTFPLAQLPRTLNADLLIKASGAVAATGASLNFSKWRRLQRAAAPPPASVQPVVVDHTTRSLRVDGELFIGLGFFVGLVGTPRSFGSVWMMPTV